MTNLCARLHFMSRSRLSHSWGESSWHLTLKNTPCTVRCRYARAPSSYARVTARLVHSVKLWGGKKKKKTPSKHKSFEARSCHPADILATLPGSYFWAHKTRPLCKWTGRETLHTQRSLGHKKLKKHPSNLIWKKNTERVQNLCPKIRVETLSSHVIGLTPASLTA